MLDSCLLLYQGMTERNFAVFSHEDGLSLENAYYFGVISTMLSQVRFTIQNIYLSATS